MSIELRDSSSEVALRNEEFNKRRLQGNNRSGGGLKVTDPEAFARLMADMKLKSEQQKRIEDEREAERARREGSAYKSKEERSREAKEAQDQFKAGEEARTLDDQKFNPLKNYYEVLGLDRAASAAEVRKAYKRLSLLYHPDKHKAEDEEQQAAIAAKFREVATAFDVLTNEAQRTVYDKCRDYIETNPGKGLPPLSPEEAAQMRSGASELSKLRRMGPKLAKHAPLHRDVEISLPNLNTGCTRPVEVERRRVDYSGKAYLSTKTFHLVIRRGSREGDKLVFEEEGEETVDTHAGDLIFTLRAKPQAVFHRKGEKDLEIYAGAVPPGEIVHAVEVESLNGTLKKVLVVRALGEALRGGGLGGVWQAVLPGMGLFDSALPWEAPPGHLHVSMRYSPVLFAERHIVSLLRLGCVYLLGSSTAPVPAAMVAGVVAAKMRHRAEVQDMATESSRRVTPSTVVCLRISTASPPSIEISSSDSPSTAAQAALRVFQKSVPGVKAFDTEWNISSSSKETCVGRETHSLSLEDSTWCALHEADVIILDLTIDGNSSGSSKDFRESAFAMVRQRLEDAGVMQALWSRHWQGTHIIAAGEACSLLGLDSSGTTTTSAVLPWYAVRAGRKGAAGWDDVCSAAASSSTGTVPGTTVVGVVSSSACVVDAVTGYADMLVVPTKEALIERAQWRGPPEDLSSVIDEADDDFGFAAAYQVC